MKKQVDVVMLSTEKASNVIKIKDKLHSIYSPNPENTLKNYKKELIKVYGDNVIQFQHLYFLSDDEIKDDNWVFDSYYLSTGKPIFRNNGKYCSKETVLLNSHLTGRYKKIIATTDESLSLPYAKTKCPKCESKMIVHLPDHIKCENCEQERWNLVRGVYDELQPLPRPSNEFLKKYCELGGIDKVLVEYEGVVQSTTWEYDEPEYYRLKIAPDNTITIYPLTENPVKSQNIK